MLSWQMKKGSNATNAKKAESGLSKKGTSPCPAKEEEVISARGGGATGTKRIVCDDLQGEKKGLLIIGKR